MSGVFIEPYSIEDGQSSYPRALEYQGALDYRALLTPPEKAPLNWGNIVRLTNTTDNPLSKIGLAFRSVFSTISEIELQERELVKAISEQNNPKYVAALESYASTAWGHLITTLGRVEEIPQKLKSLLLEEFFEQMLSSLDDRFKELGIEVDPASKMRMAIDLYGKLIGLYESTMAVIIDRARDNSEALGLAFADEMLDQEMGVGCVLFEYLIKQSENKPQYEQLGLRCSAEEFVAKISPKGIRSHLATFFGNLPFTNKEMEIEAELATVTVTEDEIEAAYDREGIDQERRLCRQTILAQEHIQTQIAGEIGPKIHELSPENFLGRNVDYCPGLLDLQEAWNQLDEGIRNQRLQDEISKLRTLHQKLVPHQPLNPGEGLVYGRLQIVKSYRTIEENIARLQSLTVQEQQAKAAIRDRLLQERRQEIEDQRLEKEIEIAQTAQRLERLRETYHTQISAYLAEEEFVYPVRIVTNPSDDVVISFDD